MQPTPTPMSTSKTVDVDVLGQGVEGRGFSGSAFWLSNVTMEKSLSQRT